MRVSRKPGLLRYGALAILVVLIGVATTFWSEASQPLVNGLEAMRVPKGFKVEMVAGANLTQYPMLGTIDDRGRLFICQSSGNTLTDQQMTEHPDYQVRMLEDTNGDGIYDKATTFADRLTLPAGAVWYRGALYVASPPDLIRFEDIDGDGVADKREAVVGGWHLASNAASLHGPYFGPDGWLYLTDGRHGYDIKTGDGREFHGGSSRIWRVRPDGTGLEWVAGGGFDNPVGLAFLPTGETIGTMTYFQDPANGQRDALMHWVWGGVYPKWYSVVSEFKRTGDLMPVMTRFARIAPAGLIRYRGTSFGPAYKDNLFSAQFNPHRIQRHIVFRAGATFRTQDEDFLTSTDPDFHPTTVIEDADGSMLVVDTGGWFIRGCPISRVAKPEIKGGIYRVRRIGAPVMRDPRGAALQLASKAPAGLTRYLQDPRPAVRDKVQELLVEAGELAVTPLETARARFTSADARCAAVWALFRIGSAAAEQGVRAALNDADFHVRIAAARAAGMARDAQAVDNLLALVKHDRYPAVRRQAATALGMIGDARAVDGLLAAAVGADDRFLEHSVTYALIELKTPGPELEALNSPNPRIRKAALISLDQMDGSPLERAHISPFLKQRDPELRKAALWVVSHHPDWSSEVITFLESRLRAPQFPASEREPTRDALLSFCGDTGVQNMVAGVLGDPNTPADRQLFLLDSVNGCTLKEFPAAWTAEIGKLLDAGSPLVRLRAVNVVREQQITSLDPQLQRIADDANAPADLRISALGSLVTHGPLNDSGLQFLVSHLKSTGRDAGLRIAAAHVIGNGRLTQEQLVELAHGPVEQVDSLVLPSLLNAYNDRHGEDVGQALIRGLLKAPGRLGEADAKRLEEILDHYPASVKTSAKPLLARMEALQKERLAHLKRLFPLLTAGGDVGRGRRIFFGDKVTCYKCHAIGEDGGRVGPDLTAIGAIRSGPDILEAIIFPSASFVPGFEPYNLETRNDMIGGILKDETPDSVTVVTGADERVRVRRKDIVAMRPSSVSIMPDKLDESLTRMELTDLLAFLQAQRKGGGMMPVESQTAATASHQPAAESRH
jgi:putative membrane-bound dehydrogenase-like protein